MAGRKWTKEEEEYLLKNYKKANRLLAKELNRNIGSVQQKLFRMGLLKPIRWTEEEDNFLVEKWDTMKLESIAKRLNRTPRAVEERAYNTLKLGTRNQWYTLKEVQEMTGINKVTIRKRIVKDNYENSEKYYPSAWRKKPKKDNDDQIEVVTIKKPKK